nr:transposase [Allomuricauda sp.]
MVEELSVQPDHVHLVCSIPLKYSVSKIGGIVKVKTASRYFQRSGI